VPLAAGGFGGGGARNVLYVYNTMKHRKIAIRNRRSIQMSAAGNRVEAVPTEGTTPNKTPQTQPGSLRRAMQPDRLRHVVGARRVKAAAARKQW
jgi:hypothetical protein